MFPDLNQASYEANTTSLLWSYTEVTDVKTDWKKNNENGSGARRPCNPEPKKTKNLEK